MTSNSMPNINWIERRAGFIVGLLFVVLMLVIMSRIEIVINLPDEPLPITIVLNPPEPEALPEEKIEPPPPPSEEVIEPEPAPQMAATAVNPVETTEVPPVVEPLPEEEIVEEAVEPEIPEQVLPMPEEEPLPLEEAPPLPVDIESWIPTSRDMEELTRINREVSEQTHELQERKEAIDRKLVRLDVEKAGREFILNSDGGMQGAIRMIDVEGFPIETVVQVLENYGIDIERRYVEPQAGRGFLNAARTDVGTFTNVQKEGFYDVFVLSAKAVNYLASLEITALQQEGYNPRNSRVREITFGIVKNDAGEYRLGVTNLEVEVIR